MKTYLPVYVICVLTSAVIAAGCASPSTADDDPAQTTASGQSDSDIPPEKRAELERVFCAETLAYLAKTSEDPVPDDCKGVIMRPTDQFGQGDNEGYLVTVIVGEEREKIELGAVVEPGGEVRLRSLQSGLNQAAVQEAELEIRNIRSMVDTFYLRTAPQRLPDQLSELVDQNITDQVPTDPWGKPYLYQKESSTEFDVYSAGPDGQADTLDDVRVE
jgi:hypothetical protein